MKACNEPNVHTYMKLGI